MSGRVIIMLVIGLGLMGLMWAKEWEHQGEKTRAATHIGCALGKGCPKDNLSALTSNHPQGCMLIGVSEAVSVPRAGAVTMSKRRAQ